MEEMFPNQFLDLKKLASQVRVPLTVLDILVNGLNPGVSVICLA